MPDTIFDTIFKEGVPTPALLIDLDIFEANIEKMSLHAKRAGINIRPHGKAHKCPEIARRQIAAGAIGICSATIGEAEQFSEAGIPGLLITSPMVGRQRIGRLIALTRRCPDLLSVVDNSAHARELSDAAAAEKVSLNVLIDIDPNLHRTGIAAGEPAMKLAETIGDLPGLNLRGIQCYSGRSAHIKGFANRRDHSHAAMAPAIETFRDLQRRGMPLEIMTGGSTGTYNIDCDLEGMTELQVGSYIFMDAEYRSIGGKNGDVYEDFGASLSVLATVVSKSRPDMATIDAGVKAFATEKPFQPEPKGIRGVEFHFAGDEHGLLKIKEASRTIELGDRLEFLVPHCDPTVNLYNQVYCLRGDRVEEIWKISRGH
jgi:D-serine deaminase-like pyridoxal phosphate-dependent protein